jgi:hypothetical protein
MCFPHGLLELIVPIRTIALAAASALSLLAVPAQAQLHWEPTDLSGPPITGAEIGIGVNLPGASPLELQAGMLWQLRAALNVAALQCDFAPTLFTTSNYNHMLAQHRSELAGAFSAIGRYFERTVGGKPGQTALDQYGTRTYSSFSTVQAQRTYCEVAGSVGREALFTPRGSLGQLASRRLGELKRALLPAPDRAFIYPGYDWVAVLPPLEEACWKRGQLTKLCAGRWPAPGVVGAP